MKPISNWHHPVKPAELTYHRLVQAILDGSLPAGSLLPNEHQLSEALGITRPTLREALQKLSANGMLDIQHGKPTRVREIWREGNLNTLSAILATQHASLTAQWVPQMLEVRLALAPQYAFHAVKRNAAKTAAEITALTDGLPEKAEAFALADWQLHQTLTVLSNNPIYTLILNGFQDFYPIMAVRYFTLAESRTSSRRFYASLSKAASEENAEKARLITAQVMAESLALWDKSNIQMNMSGKEEDHVEP